jgi:hypothetical protein
MTAGERVNPYGGPVITVDELDSLDPVEMVEGYHDGFKNEPAPRGNRSKAYWHGWRNGMVDGGHAKIDEAQYLLAAVAKSPPHPRI